MFKRFARTARTVAAGLRSVVTPAYLVRSLDDTVADPADVYADEEMPTVQEIETAAAAYVDAADLARAADRSKRQAKKVLGRLPAGLYGRFLVERVRSSRQTPDLEAIRATYKRLDLGPVPMKDVAASLRITEAVQAALVEPDATPVLVAA
ncbi:hypothetical protein [Streptomyces sp. XY533]|uniref:hypothetical protein n=1 Tax=Streptomyces sp. XY533 TaxID=1519481 RepID=UPI0006AE6DAA|nr:hypothetical protein [Streptomyces sp. XY533]KOU99110.1 hypothetical protein ADK92_12975 [Streptomyces sp. XY533]